MGKMACCRPGWGAGIGLQWEPGGTLYIIAVPPEGTLFRCEIPALRMDSELFDQFSDLMNCFDLWCDKGVNDISSLCDSPGVFPQNWLPPQLSYTGLLEVTGVHFDVIVRSLFCADKSVHFGAEPVVSDVTEDGDRIPMTTSARSWGGDSECSEWLKFIVARGGAYGSSNQSALMHRHVLPEWGDGVNLDCVHSAGISGSPASDRVTAPCSSSLSPGCVV